MAKGVAGTIVNLASTNGVGKKGIDSVVDPAQANKKSGFMNAATVPTNFIVQKLIARLAAVSCGDDIPAVNEGDGIRTIPDLRTAMFPIREF